MKQSGPAPPAGSAEQGNAGDAFGPELVRVSDARIGPAQLIAVVRRQLQAVPIRSVV
jgi:hypothetical protein